MIIIVCKQLQIQVTILYTNKLHTIIWFKVFISSSHNFQTDQFQTIDILTYITLKLDIVQDSIL